MSGAIEPIVTAEAFHAMTGNAYVGNGRVESALLAASQAIRNYCGWHISPSLSCVAYPTGGAVVMRLPAAYVSAVNEIAENGNTLAAADYQWRHDGLLKRTAPDAWSDAWNGITVNYTAGYDAAAVPDLVEAVCAIASGVLSVSAGVISESADGVSISYSSNASSIAAALTSQQKSALEAYKVISAHAA